MFGIKVFPVFKCLVFRSPLCLKNKLYCKTSNVLTHSKKVNDFLKVKSSFAKGAAKVYGGTVLKLKLFSIQGVLMLALISSIHRRFSIRFRISLSLVIPNDKMLEH